MVRRPGLDSLRSSRTTCWNSRSELAIETTIDLGLRLFPYRLSGNAGNSRGVGCQRPKTVLMADDNRYSGRVLCRILEVGGALRYLRGSAERCRSGVSRGEMEPDIILDPPDAGDERPRGSA